MSHTPTPWSIESNDLVTIYADDDCDLHPIASTAGNPTCRMLDEQEANAAHIVRCVNAHDELVTALRNVLGAQQAEAKARLMCDAAVENYSDSQRELNALVKAQVAASEAEKHARAIITKVAA